MLFWNTAWDVAQQAWKDTAQETQWRFEHFTPSVIFLKDRQYLILKKFKIQKEF